MVGCAGREYAIVPLLNSTTHTACPLQVSPRSRSAPLSPAPHSASVKSSSPCCVRLPMAIGESVVQGADSRASLTGILER